MACCIIGEPGCPQTLDTAKGYIDISVDQSLLPSEPKLVRWHSNGEARFHHECWDKLCRLNARKHRAHSKELKLIKQAKDTAEIHESVENFKNKADSLAKAILASSYCVAFTGAGISTSAGIGDYRGKSGKWTGEDWRETKQEIEGKGGEIQRDGTEEEEEDGVEYEQLRPTYTHEALHKLGEIGKLKLIISQNGDGLHRLSGVEADKLCELHGNVFVEFCDKCKTRYERPYYTPDDIASEYWEEVEDYGETTIIRPKHAKKCDTCGLSHYTGRKCTKPKCTGQLKDSIINFGDMLPQEQLDKSEDAAKRCDLMLSLGTTMLVTPACDLVTMGNRNRPLAICNRQTTQLDSISEKHGLRLFGDCDDMFRRVMPQVLGEDECRRWEGGREARLEEYNKLRESEDPKDSSAKRKGDGDLQGDTKAKKTKKQEAEAAPTPKVAGRASGRTNK